MHPVGSQGPQAALHLLQGSSLVGVALETPQPSHPDSGSLTTTVLSTGFPVTACELLLPVFQPLAGPLADSPGSSVSACRSVMTADSHRTQRQAKGERQHHCPGPQRRAPSDGWCAACCPRSSLSSTQTQKVLREHPRGLWGFRLSKCSSGVQSTLRRGPT